MSIVHWHAHNELFHFILLGQAWDCLLQTHWHFPISHRWFALHGFADGAVGQLHVQIFSFHWCPPFWHIFFMLALHLFLQLVWSWRICAWNPLCPTVRIVLFCSVAATHSQFLGDACEHCPRHLFNSTEYGLYLWFGESISTGILYSLHLAAAAFRPAARKICYLLIWFIILGKETTGKKQNKKTLLRKNASPRNVVSFNIFGSLLSFLFLIYIIL